MKTYFIEQKITPLANQYRVFEAGKEGKRKLVAFAQQKRLAFKEEVKFYKDEAKSEVSHTVKAEKALDFHGKFLVRNERGKEIGAVRKAFKSSLLRSTWEILDEDEPVLIVRERSQGIAIFRRIWGFLPLIGDFPFFLKYHFDFLDATNEKTVATYTKTNLFFDHYKLEVADESILKKIGWQTLVTQAVLLDALQGR